jgi:hypothetical protein
LKTSQRVPQLRFEFDDSTGCAVARSQPVDSRDRLLIRGTRGVRSSGQFQDLAQPGE